MGETQERERVLVHFSKRFCHCNPEALTSEGKCHCIDTLIMVMDYHLLKDPCHSVKMSLHYISGHQLVDHGLGC